MKIPHWMKKQFQQGECSHCRKKLVKDGIKGHGIFEDKNEESKLSHYYHYVCPTCKLETKFNFPTDWQDFVYSMLELAEPEDAEIQSKTKKIKVTGISQKELDHFKEMMDESKTFDDFLTKIGIKTEEYTDDENK